MGVKISELPDATLPLDGTEELPIVQSGTTVKTTVADLAGSGTLNATTFTTNGSGAATVVALIGKTAGTDLHLFEYSPDAISGVWGTNLYGFVSGTGAFSGLSPSTKYLVFYE